MSTTPAPASTELARNVLSGQVLDTPRYRVLSLGAGIQSTTLFIMSAQGILPKLDFAIFADTGAEPKEVYEHLDRLEREVAIPAGIPILRVRQGDLDQDLFDPNKMSTIPAYTASDWETVTKVAAWKLCGGEGGAPVDDTGDQLPAGQGCGWARFRALADKSKRKWKGLFDDLLIVTSAPTPDPQAQAAEEPAAVPEEGQASGLAVTVPRVVTLADLEAQAAERPTYGPEDDHAPTPAVTVSKAMRLLGMQVLPDPCGRCNSSGRIPTAWQHVQERHLGMIQRRCTQKYKLRPIMEQVRLLLGAKIGKESFCRHCNGTGERVAPWRAQRGETEVGECSVCEGVGTISRVGQPPTGEWVEQWIGFSTDEAGRVSTRRDSAYSKSRFPLLEMNMSRTQCVAFLASRGWGKTPKSACYFCPYRSNASWRRMRDTNPAEFQRAVTFDALYRNGPGLDHSRYLHVSVLPLGQAPIDKIQRREHQQSNILDAMFEGALELEDEQEDEVQGCSPFGCPSGGQTGGLLQIQSRPAA